MSEALNLANLSGNACHVCQFLKEILLRGSMEFLRNHERQAMLLVRLLHLANLACICLFISNNTPLLFLTVLGVFYYFFVHGNRPGLHMTACLAFFAFVIAFSQYSEPHTGLFRFYRIQLFAFLAGIAVYMAYRKVESFFYPLAPLFCLIAIAFMAVKCVSTGAFFDSLFLNRMEVLTIHPNIIGIVSSLAVIVSATHLLCPTYTPDLQANVPGWRKVVEQCNDFLRSRATASFCMLFAFMVTVLTQSRGALFSLLAAFLFCVALSTLSRLGFKRFVLVAALSAGVFYAIWGAIPIKDAMRDAAEIRIVHALKAPWKEWTFKSRVPAWESSLEIIEEKPFLGHGYRAFRDLHRAFVAEHYDELVEQFGKEWVDEDTFNLIHSHNQYLMTGVEQGVVGLVPLVLLCFLWPFCAMLRNKTFYGPSGAILVFFAVNFTVESYLTRMPYAVAGATFLFMTVGWLSCAMSKKKC